MNKKLASRSLSALVFALGASQSAHASDVQIQSLELSEEMALSAEEFEQLAGEIRASRRSSSRGSPDNLITSGNYGSLITSGNYSSLITAGNYADLITSGNYANLVTSGNYGRISPNDVPDAIPSPQLAEAELEDYE